MLLAGALEALVGMLGNADSVKSGELSSREAAGIALRDLAAIDRSAQEEILFQLCAYAKQHGQADHKGEPSFIVAMASLFHVPANSESLAAAGLIVQLTADMQVQVSPLR